MVKLSGRGPCAPPPTAPFAQTCAFPTALACLRRGNLWPCGRQHSRASTSDLVTLSLPGSICGHSRHYHGAPGTCGPAQEALESVCLPSPVRRERPPERSLSEGSKQGQALLGALVFCFFLFSSCKNGNSFIYYTYKCRCVALFIIQINVDVCLHTNTTP